MKNYAVVLLVAALLVAVSFLLLYISMSYPSIPPPFLCWLVLLSILLGMGIQVIVGKIG